MTDYESTTIALHRQRATMRVIDNPRMIDVIVDLNMCIIMNGSLYRTRSSYRYIHLFHDFGMVRCSD